MDLVHMTHVVITYILELLSSYWTLMSQKRLLTLITLSHISQDTDAEIFPILSLDNYHKLTKGYRHPWLRFNWIQCSRIFFFDQQPICLKIWSKSSHISIWLFMKKFGDDQTMFDDFEQIIRHFLQNHQQYLMGRWFFVNTGICCS